MMEPMNLLREKFQASAVCVRVMPFVIFILLTAMPAILKEIAPQYYSDSSVYWFYLAKTVVGGWLIWEMRPFVSEMRWALSWEAVAVGILVFAMWVGADPFFPHIKAPGPVWNPHEHFGENSPMAWGFLIVRIVGMSLVVPPLEEVFYRSFLYRYFVRTDFLNMPLGRFHPTSFIITSVLFGFEHSQWLAGILCGFAFQGLAVRKNRVSDAITAHAITNFLLGIWVVWRHDWKFF
ncbi:MAG TPA: CAAX prenyl protease-related protein [Verrucomicrobiae bacterium]|nr:CAAX prenyl protease-related protein [Verrucomicrobiae bacterium]